MKRQSMNIGAIKNKIFCWIYNTIFIKKLDVPGQFAIRGGIIDIYSHTDETPVRIELWDDEIDSIRFFDAV